MFHVFDDIAETMLYVLAHSISVSPLSLNVRKKCDDGQDLDFMLISDDMKSQWKSKHRKFY